MAVISTDVAMRWTDIRNAIENKKSNPQQFDRVYIGKVVSPANAPVHMRKRTPRKAKPLAHSAFVLSEPLAGIALTRREMQVLFLICHGHTNREVAELMGLSSRTAEYYIKNIRKKTLTLSKVHLVQLATQSDFLDRVDRDLLLCNEALLRRDKPK